MTKYLKIVFGYKTHRHMQVYWNNFLSNHFPIKYQFNFPLKCQTINVAAKGEEITQWLRALVALPVDGSTQHHLR